MVLECVTWLSTCCLCMCDFILVVWYLFFFFKQKTAYEMRISDWSSDVCSSDLGVAGESWSVHGGGFYHKRKFMPAPPQLPQTLHWSKWKSYTTWLSGFALFADRKSTRLNSSH